ncbi:hypothetical protein N7445_005989 [Penicillium cf. griseofulvum]|nr:hypothetical protein N7445_005989 [Penicillium cf. griseofulvum]
MEQFPSTKPMVEHGAFFALKKSVRPIYYNWARFFNKAGWPNGKALDYESRDCRFDPCVGQFFLLRILFACG